MNRPSNELAPSAGIWPLLSLNFFMADMQAGIGPFLGVFLLARGWESGLIGTVMTVGGVAGMLMTTPAGALIDATRRKKLYVVIPGICTVAASGFVLLSQSFWLVTLSQVATAVAGAAIGSAVTGITLGMVRQSGFSGRMDATRRSTMPETWWAPACRACSDGSSVSPPC